MIPESFERFFYAFDNTLIKWCQKLHGPAVTYLALAITGLTAIEVGFCAPFVLFVLGWDGIATEVSYLMLILALFSQIPKRFIWRFRPYMVKRAKKCRKKESATTSSFPSRAVTCATVYSFIICYSYIHMYVKDPSGKSPSHYNHDINFEKGAYFIRWWMPLLILFSVLVSSWSRVTLGVHYPSDCIFGFIQGIIVSTLGTLLWHVDTWGCSSCFGDKCYTSIHSEHSINIHHFDRANWMMFLIASMISVMIAAVSVLKPIDFWEKCDRVYGMLLPGIVFQLTFLCPNASHASLSVPPSAPWYSYFYGVLVAAAATGAAYANKGRYSVLCFLILYMALYFALATWRSWLVTL